MDGRSVVIIMCRVSDGIGWRTAWRRAATWRAGLAWAAAFLLLCGCGGPDWPGGGVKSFDLGGKITFSGPLPVYQAYDGVNPLAFYMRAGLLKPGTNTLAAYLDYYRETGDPYGSNVTGDYQLGQPIDDDFVPAGTYDFAIYSADPPGSEWLQLGNAVQNIVYRGPQATIDYAVGSQQLTPITINFTGPGPYGSASGRVLTSGYGYAPMVQLVIKPVHPLPGVSAETGLLWQADYQQTSHGQVWFTIPDLSYGEYELSYAGSSIHDRDAPLEVGSQHFTISAAQPDVEGLDFKATDAWQINPSWELGHISGTLTLPAAPVAGAAYCVEARLLNPTSGGAPSYYDQAAWLAAADDFNATQATFDLRWLTAGQYSITVYELASAPVGQDLALNVFGPYELPSSNRELTGVTLEVQP
jgi:hypothetical protein